jgi:acetyltransferase-like isoleucine patch superfamily enzyme
MPILLKDTFSADRLARDLGLELIGPDRLIRRLCTLDALTDDGLSFALPGRDLGVARGGTVFALGELGGNGVSVISTAKPRLDFIRAQYMLQSLPGFDEALPAPILHPSVKVCQGAVIENGVSIGEGSVVGPNAVVRSGTRIGRFCEVKSGAVIGDSGFGFERDQDNNPIRMIHLGGVVIGDHVEIGSLTTVVKGALGDTVLEDYVKVNDHVHIAHNCRIGARTMIGACADLSGSLKVGRDVWIAPNCSIRQKLVIGEGAVIGIGAVVVKNVQPGVTVVGNPAKMVEKAAALSVAIAVALL